MQTAQERLLLYQLREDVTMGNPVSVSALIALLNSNDWANRVGALGIVTAMSAPPNELVTRAEALLNDEYDLVRVQATRAIYRHSQRALDVLSRHRDESKLVNDILKCHLRDLDRRAAGQDNPLN
jgi:hypothetical protein